MIEIQQDSAIDEDCEVGMPMHVYWCEGHNIDPQEFFEAVLAHCLEEGDIPRIRPVDYYNGPEDRPVELWQWDRTVGSRVIYERTVELPPPMRRAVPVTVLDLERRWTGGYRCSVLECRLPWSRTTTHQAVLDADSERLYMQLPLCRTHVAMMPEPSYRVVFVPVGSTVELPPPEDDSREAAS